MLSAMPTMTLTSAMIDAVPVSAPAFQARTPNSFPNSFHPFETVSNRL
jgi:hypothetical protein